MCLCCRELLLQGHVHPARVANRVAAHSPVLRRDIGDLAEPFEKVFHGLRTVLVPPSSQPKGVNWSLGIRRTQFSVSIQIPGRAFPQSGAGQRRGSPHHRRDLPAINLVPRATKAQRLRGPSAFSDSMWIGRFGKRSGPIDPTYSNVVTPHRIHRQNSGDK